MQVRATNAKGFSVAELRSRNWCSRRAKNPNRRRRSSSRPPTLSGVAVEGRQLTAHRGVWENEPLTYEEKWFRCKGRNPEGTGAACKVIARKNPVTGKGEPATGNTYVTGAEDVGLWIEDQETAENTGGWNVAVSLAVQIASPSPPTNVTPPQITGIAQKGQTLTVQPGTGATRPRLRGGSGCAATNRAASCSEIKSATAPPTRSAPKTCATRSRSAKRSKTAPGAARPSARRRPRRYPRPPAPRLR